MNFLEKFRKNVKMIDKFLLASMVFLMAIVTPVGIWQYALFADGKPYSVGFMAMGSLFPVVFAAKIKEIARR